MNIRVTEEAIDNFLKKEKQNDKSFIELFPNVDPNKIKEIFKNDNYDYSNDLCSFNDEQECLEDTEDTDESLILNEEDDIKYIDIFNKETNFEKFEIMEKNKDNNFIPLKKSSTDSLNENNRINEKEYIKGNKFLEFLSRNNQTNLNINTNLNIMSNKGETELCSQRDLINPINVQTSITETSKFSIPNLVENSGTNVINNYRDKEEEELKINSYDNTDLNENTIKNEEHEDIVKKLQKLLLKQENEISEIKKINTNNKNVSNKDKFFNANKNDKSMIKEDIFNKEKKSNENNNINFFDYKDDNTTIDPDMILLKVKKYGEEMNQMKKELMNNYYLNCKSLYKFSNIKSTNNEQKKKKDENNYEPQIEEISLKSDFWKSSNLAISRKELDLKNNESGEENSNMSSKPFLKVDNYVSWEE